MFHNMMLPLGFFYDYNTSYDLTCKKTLIMETTAPRYEIKFKFRVLTTKFTYKASYVPLTDKFSCELFVTSQTQRIDNMELNQELYVVVDIPIERAKREHSKLYRKMMDIIVENKERTNKTGTPIQEENLIRHIQELNSQITVRVLPFLKELENQVKGRVGAYAQIEFSNIIDKRCKVKYVLNRENNTPCTTVSFYVEKGNIHNFKSYDNYNYEGRKDFKMKKYYKNQHLTDVLKEVGKITTATPLPTIV